jgi:hypothetical protein
MNDTQQPVYDAIQKLWQSGPDLQKLENSDCESAFSTALIQPPYHNLLVVTNHTSNDTFLNGFSEAQLWDTTNKVPWYDGENFGISHNSSGGHFNYSSGSSWVMPVSPVCNTTDLSTGTSFTECTAAPAHVQYCLAQAAAGWDGQCTISISVTLLVVVIICTFIKAVCLAMVLLAKHFHPLATVGDAVASFIVQPDITSVGLGLVSLSNVVEFPAKGRSMVQNVKSQRLWEPKTHRWAYAITSGFCIFGLV